MSFQRMRQMIGWAAAVTASLFLSAPAFAQCAMCYASATAAGSKGIHALKVGILVLALPTMSIFGALLLIAYRRRDPDRHYARRPYPFAQVTNPELQIPASELPPLGSKP